MIFRLWRARATAATIAPATFDSRASRPVPPRYNALDTPLCPEEPPFEDQRRDCARFGALGDRRTAARAAARPRAERRGQSGSDPPPRGRWRDNPDVWRQRQFLQCGPLRIRRHPRLSRAGGRHGQLDRAVGRAGFRQVARSGPCAQDARLPHSDGSAADVSGDARWQ